MTEKKTLQDIASEVLSDAAISKAIETAQLPTFEPGQVVNWKGRAAKVNQMFGNGTVEIEITEFHTVKAADIR